MFNGESKGQTRIPEDNQDDIGCAIAVID